MGAASALGVSFFLANSMQLLFGAQQRDYDTFSLCNQCLYLKGFHVGGEVGRQLTDNFRNTARLIWPTVIPT